MHSQTENNHMMDKLPFHLGYSSHVKLQIGGHESSLKNLRKWVCWAVLNVWDVSSALHITRVSLTVAAVLFFFKWDTSKCCIIQGRILRPALSGPLPFGAYWKVAEERKEAHWLIGQQPFCALCESISQTNGGYCIVLTVTNSQQSNEKTKKTVFTKKNTRFRVSSQEIYRFHHYFRWFSLRLVMCWHATTTMDKDGSRPQSTQPDPKEPKKNTVHKEVNTLQNIKINQKDPFKDLPKWLFGKLPDCCSTWLDITCVHQA